MSDDALSARPGPDRLPRRSLTFIGTTTMLLRLGEFTVLTDPNFLHRGQRAYLGWRLTSRRLTEPALDIAELREVPRRFPRLDVMAMHLGGTRPPGGLKVTMDAEDGADLMEERTTPQAVPVHNDDYPVFTSPLSAFRQAVTRRGLERRVAYAEPGRPINLDRLGAGDDPARG